MVAHLTFVACHGAMTVIVFVVAYALFCAAIGRDSEARRLHGRYVLGWSVAAYAVGPLALLAIHANPSADANVPAALVTSYIVGMFFLLGGWAVGTLHGAIAVAVCRVRRSPGRRSVRNRALTCQARRTSRPPLHSPR